MEKYELDLIFDAGYRNHVLKEIQNAKKSLDIAIFHLGYYANLKTYFAKVETRIIINNHYQMHRDRNLARVIKEKLGGIAKVKFMRDMHAKIIIIDKKRLIMGSCNLTKKSLYYNHEAGITTDIPELVEPTINLFNDWWERAKEES